MLSRRSEKFVCVFNHETAHRQGHTEIWHQIHWKIRRENWAEKKLDVVLPCRFTLVKDTNGRLPNVGAQMDESDCVLNFVDIFTRLFLQQIVHVFHPERKRVVSLISCQANRCQIIYTGFY